MTNNELKKAIKNLEIGNSTMGENEYVKIRKNVLESILANYKELLKLRELQKPNMMIENIDKQEPKKVIVTDDECLCQSCKFDMMGVWDEPEAENPNYCPRCGQALDWSD